MIDEEGGTVTRISRIIKHDLYQKLFGDIYKINTKVSKTLYKKYLFDVVSFLKKVGININTVPVLDILEKIQIRLLAIEAIQRIKILLKIWEIFV